MENMEKVLVDHEVHTVKKSRWEDENDDIERYEIRDDYGFILAVEINGIDENGGFCLIRDQQENCGPDILTSIFLDHDLAYDLAYQYEQTERHRLIREEREKIHKKEREEWRMRELHRQEFIKNNPYYADENKPPYVDKIGLAYANENGLFYVDESAINFTRE